MNRTVSKKFFDTNCKNCPNYLATVANMSDQTKVTFVCDNSECQGEIS